MKECNCAACNESNVQALIVALVTELEEMPEVIRTTQIIYNDTVIYEINGHKKLSHFFSDGNYKNSPLSDTCETHQAFCDMGAHLRHAVYIDNVCYVGRSYVIGVV